MKLVYKIEEEDFLQYQLFTASQSDQISKKLTTGRILTAVIFLLCGVYSFYVGSIGLAVYFFVIASVCALYYATYFKWRYRKHYKGFIQENYTKRFGKKAILEFKEDHLFSKDEVGEGKVNYSQIEIIDEIPNYFFLKIATGASIIIPKSELDDEATFKKEIQRLGFEINEMLDWKW